MKAVAAFPGTRHVEVIECEPPRLEQPDDVLVDVLDVGICGTDKEICSFEYGNPPPGEDHLVIGHEALGRVLAVGSAVEALRPGDLVVPTVRRPCPDPSCRACRAGHQDYCYTGGFAERGIKDAHGFMAERVVEHQQHLVPVPAELGDVAVLTEPLTIAEKALAQVFWLMQHRPPWLDPDAPAEERGTGLSALVLGAGPVGILGAMAIRAAGFDTYVYSRELPPSARSDLVDALGATYVSSQTTDPEELAAEIGNIDLVYEAVGHTEFALEVLRTLGPNGIFVLTGVPGLQTFDHAHPAGLMRDMVLKNQFVLGTVNAGRQAFAAAVRDLEVFERQWPQPTHSLIAGRYPPEQASELVVSRTTGIKSVIAFHDAD
ncbi:MAG TPA: glucose 1-dehydrogenase [Acidimicrobiia bacterium]|nr:glucose 1-dehydrogenase [Acidimicrobiia bacterium]